MTQSLDKKTPPEWLLAFFEQTDDKSFGSAFNVLADDIAFTFGVAEWHGREEVIDNLKKFDRDMDTKHTVTEYWDGGMVKMLHGVVEMTAHKDKKTTKPRMAHFIYMDADDPSIVKRWVGAVGPVGL